VNALRPGARSGAFAEEGEKYNGETLAETEAYVFASVWRTLTDAD
jgi:hypothetical protein